jgi:phage terminase large subunit GpA-like protein
VNPSHAAANERGTDAAAADVVASAVESFPLWTDAECRAWRLPEVIDLPAWSEKYRYLTRRQTTKERVGYWRNVNSPALIGYMRLLERPGILRITVLKHSQGGWSEATRNFIGRNAHLEPDPFLVVLPDEKTGKGIVHHRLLPLFQDTEVLRDLSTGRRWDQKNDEIVLANGFTLRLGYSGSIASVAAHPARWVFCDERSKFQEDGKVSIADSIDARTSQYEQSLVIEISTPGPDPDPTDQGFQNANVQLFYFVACPRCRERQRITFHALEWEPKKDEEPEKKKRAERVVADGSVWLKCQNPKCAELYPEGRGRITDDERREILQDGFWAPEDLSWRLYNDGREEGTWQRGWLHVGMHAPAFTSLAPKHSLHLIARKFILAEGDAEATQGVYNELFAEVYRQSDGKDLVTNVFQRKCRADPLVGFVPPKAKMLPPWTARLVLSVDTQKDYFWFVLRAYGAGGRSRRIHHGKAFSFDELTMLADQSFWPYEGDVLPARRVDFIGIDSGGGTKTRKAGVDGSRTDEVYRWCLLDPIRRIPLKGESEARNDAPLRWRRVTYTPPGGKSSPYEVRLLLVDTHHHQDLLVSDVGATMAVLDEKTGEVIPDRTEDRWELNDADDEEYNRHLANVSKKLIRTGARGRKTVERYMPKTVGARHDYRDCEVYQQAMAHGPAGCMALPTAEQMVAAAKVSHAPAASGGISLPGGRNWGYRK